MTLRQAYGPMLAQLVQDSATRRQIVRATLLLAVGEILLLTLYDGRRGQAGTLVLVCMPWVALQLWCGAFLKNAVRQNRPEYAGLVPHLRNRLIRVTAAMYAVEIALLAVVSGLVFGHAGYGLVFGGVFTVLSILMNRYMALAWVMALAIPFGMSYAVNDLPPLLAGLNEAAVTAVAMVPIVLLGGWGLHLILPRGGDDHWRWQAQFNQRQDALTCGRSSTSAKSAPSRLRQVMQSFYLAALRRDSQRGVAADRALMHAIGPGAHPARMIAFSLVSTLLALVIGRFLSDGARTGMTIATGLMQLGAVLMYAISVADDVVLHGAEQQLYFLTPSAPAAARINRLLVTTVLRRALAAWLVSLACVAGLDSVLADHLSLHGVSFAMSMVVLWTVTPLLRNYAVAPAQRLGVTWTVVIVIMVLVCLGAVGLLQLAPNFPWYEVGSVAGLGALIYMVLRFRALMALPPVLPAGRLAV
ncbi:hypothetical protein [Duganella levis]|uniref:Uncharacterized protein n=1 Tax=Duganella levis TaxID=2692169 RepID=A0ABW9W2X0_9BURK|nr:hypothetical protein [Duganella levis]MYN28344.1 hypothetical protein [Duganella levis]